MLSWLVILATLFPNPAHPAACDPAYPVMVVQLWQDTQDRKRQDAQDESAFLMWTLLFY